MFLKVFRRFSLFYAQEQKTPVALFLSATGAIRSRRSRTKIGIGSLKNSESLSSLFRSQQTSDSLEKPKSKFPTLVIRSSIEY